MRRLKGCPSQGRLHRMGELAEPQVQTEGVPLAREDFVHKQYNLRNLLHKGMGNVWGAE